MRIVQQELPYAHRIRARVSRHPLIDAPLDIKINTNSTTTHARAKMEARKRLQASVYRLLIFPDRCSLFLSGFQVTLPFYRAGPVPLGMRLNNTDECGFHRTERSRVKAGDASSH